jgi:hypothetical protein
MRGRTTRGSAKVGAALLAGLLRCGRCGRKLVVTYTGRGEGKLVRYVCRSSHVRHAGEKCISFAGRKVDEAVVTVLLEALQPAGVEAALATWESFSHQEDETRRQLELAVEKARYLADRARRQFDAVEPENRLVATELECRWNEALVELQQLQHRLEQTGPASQPLLPEERDRLLKLGHDVAALWAHSDASITLKKRILRTVLKEIVADVTSQPPAVALHLHWSGGVHTPLQVSKNRPGEHRRRTDQQVVELVRELAPLCDDLQVAHVLNRLGYRTGAGNTWTASRVESVRRHHEIAPREVTEPRSWLTLEQAAERLQVSRKFLRSLLAEGVLPGRQVVPYAPWVIEAASLDLPQVRTAVADRGRKRIRPWHPSVPPTLPLFSEG